MLASVSQSSSAAEQVFKHCKNSSGCACSGLPASSTTWVCEHLFCHFSVSRRLVEVCLAVCLTVALKPLKQTGATSLWSRRETANYLD